MNIGQLKRLIKELEADAEGADDQTEVRMANQPSYPFEYSISGVSFCETKAEEIADCLSAIDDCENDEENKKLEEKLARLQEQNEKVVYLLEGSQLGYISREIWDDRLCI